MPAVQTALAESVRIAYIEEVTPGTFPVAGNFKLFRKTTDSLDGNVQVKQSQECAGDGQPRSPKQVGLDVTGDLSGELAPSICFQDFMRSALRKTAWGGTITSGALALTINSTAKTISRAAGSFVTDGFKVGDAVQLSNFVNTANNNCVVWLSVVSALSVTYISDELVNETGLATTTMVRPNYIEYGANDIWFWISKESTDLANKGNTYRDRVATMSLDFKYGDFAMVKFGMAGTFYDPNPTTLITASRTIDPITAEAALNASSDLGTIVIDGVLADYCIETLSLQTNLTMQAVNSCGKLAPLDQRPTGLTVDVSMDIYLTDSNFALHKSKLSQTPINIQYWARDDVSGGGYAVRIPRVHLSFPDFATSGKGQVAKLSAKGSASYDAVSNNTLRLYKLV